MNNNKIKGFSQFTNTIVYKGDIFNFSSSLLPK